MSLSQKMPELIREILKERAVPELRKRGFKGSFPHFRRPTDSKLELITFQFDKWGSGDFVVNLGSCPPNGVTMAWGQHIPASRVSAYDVHPTLRLGAESADSNFWFRSDSFASDPESSVAELLHLLDTQGEMWWGVA